MGFKRTSLGAAALTIFAAVARCDEPSFQWPSSCDEGCQQAILANYQIERAQWVNPDIENDPFYATPKDMDRYAPGDVIRWEDLIISQGVTPTGLPTNTTWAIPESLTLARFIFASEDEHGNSIPSSAFALMPFTNVNGSATPMNTVAWSHGTSGVERVCGPANNNELWYSWAGPFFLASSGFAVIAPDYSGLGTEIPGGFKYEAGRLHAIDVGNSIKAARAHYGKKITHDWVSIGHSEGGMTAWRVAENEARPGNATGGYLGSVSVSPALRPSQLIPGAWKQAGDGPVGDPEEVLFFRALSRAYPDEVSVEKYLTKDMQKYMSVIDKSCLITVGAVVANLTVKDMYSNTSWVDLPIVKEYEAKFNMPGPWPLAGPMLVVQGTGDKLTFGKDTEDDFKKTCDKYPDSTAELLLYPGQDHMPTMYASWGQIIPWIYDRFNGKPLSKGCKTTTIQPSFYVDDSKSSS
ncbi:hypothetical protein KEM52_005126 [Ascosphaera acerosa]|nr:hypothetical protein KEM52_005126 [Ascosphaera acerosa]